MISRQEKLNRKLKEKEIDAFLLTNSLNIFYLYQVWIEGAVLVTPERNFFISSPIYKEEVMKKEREGEIIVYEDTLEKELEKLTGKLRLKKYGIEANHLSLSKYNKIKGKIKGEVIPCEGIVEEIRSIKEKGEIDKIRKAGEVTVAAFNYLKEFFHPGITEKELAREAVNYFLEKAEDVSFPPIILFGERTSLPHARPTHRKLRKNELVLVDIGAKLEDYCADLTRTFLWGEVSEKWKRIYRLVKQVQEVAIESVRPGVKCCKIDEKVREKISAAGYGSGILHGTGHGVGLEVHERPVVRYTSDETLEEGMIVTIEPGIYLPGEGGIRIEDMVLVTSQGGKILP